MSSPTEMKFEFRYLKMITSMLPAGTCDILVYIIYIYIDSKVCVSLASLSCVCGCVHGQGGRESHAIVQGLRLRMLPARIEGDST